MTDTKDTSVKILFRFFSDVLDEWTVETLWADVINPLAGTYRLDSIPFYAPVASDDIIFAEFDETEQMLTYRETLEFSGNSIVQIVLIDTSKDLNTIRDMFRQKGLASEKLNDRYFAMEIPANKNYIPIRQQLVRLESMGIIGFAEPCLSTRHQY